MRKLVVVVAAALLLGGCTRYIADGVPYNTRAEAVQATRDALDARGRAIPEANPRLGGSALIVLPSRETLRLYGFKPDARGSEEGFQYLVDILEIGSQGRAEGVGKAAIFDRTAIVRTVDVERTPFDGYDYKLYFVHTAPAEWAWFLARPGDSRTERVKSALDQRGVEAEVTFHTNLVKAGQALDAPPAAPSAAKP